MWGVAAVYYRTVHRGTVRMNVVPPGAEEVS
jgi:hypothetical protein